MQNAQNDGVYVQKDNDMDNSVDRGTLMHLQKVQH